jgi:hypothetical protein
VDDALIHREARVAGELRVPANLVAVEARAARQILKRLRDKRVDLRECLPGSQKAREPPVSLDDALRRGTSAILVTLGLHGDR